MYQFIPSNQIMLKICKFVSFLFIGILNFMPILCRGQTEIIFKITHPHEDLEYVFKSTCYYYKWDSTKRQTVLLKTIPITFELSETRDKLIIDDWKDIYQVPVDEGGTIGIWIWKAMVPTVIGSTSTFMDIEVDVPNSDIKIYWVDHQKIEIGSPNIFIRFIRS